MKRTRFRWIGREREINTLRGKGKRWNKQFQLLPTPTKQYVEYMNKFDMLNQFCCFHPRPHLQSFCWTNEQRWHFEPCLKLTTPSTLQDNTFSKWQWWHERSWKTSGGDLTDYDSDRGWWQDMARYGKICQDDEQDCDQDNDGDEQEMQVNTTWIW